MIGFLKKILGGDGKSAEKPSAATSSGGTDYEGFVSYVVRRLVNKPDAVRLETVEQNGENSILIHCEKSDIAKVIGKRGRTISGIRLLVGGAANRNNEHVKVDVVD